MKVYLVKSLIHPWRVWKTTSPEPMEDRLRFRGNKENYPIAVPPTTGDRVDFIASTDDKLIHGYNYKPKGWFIIIKNGEINDILENH